MSSLPAGRLKAPGRNMLEARMASGAITEQQCHYRYRWALNAMKMGYNQGVTFSLQGVW